jgi:hypothetical protein
VVTGAAFFNTDVRSAQTAIKSFRFDYANSDHHINVIEARSEVTSTPGTSTAVRVICQYAASTPTRTSTTRTVAESSFW